MSSVITARAGMPQRAEIARQALRTGRRALAAWVLAFVAMVVMYSAIWPSIRGNTSWRDLFNTLPQAYRAMFTASGTLDLSTPSGYLGVELMGFLGPALIALYAITAGSAAVAGEEARGGLEITLSAPVSRAAVLAQRFVALLIDLTLVMAATAATMWICSAALHMGLSPGRIAAATAALGTFGLLAGAVALAVGAATGSAAAARGVAALVAVASYLINALSQLTSALRGLRPVSPYYLVLGNEPLAHGLRWWGALAVLAVVVALVAAGGLAFTRRDLG